ncbi:transcription initiation factor TFIIB [Natrinema hispanicum]|uniref:TFIIB zinc-binding n=1 Tax=Natrinema hispanicum TaxID=392421 RepID=A0A1I0JBB0_9EURY|nr:transcription initiation factor TFIIB [Natrinema hispanicum]SEU06579.1 TFIIB zinc-binding [Natrinema hispanicum]
MVRPTQQRERDQMSVTEADEHENENQSEEQTCPECDSGALVASNDSNEIICEDCGLVIEEQNIDHGPEWRAFNHAERQNKSRVGAPTTQTMHDKGLTTQIDWKNKDAHGRSISSKKRNQLNRLRKWQERIRTKDAGERNLQFALSEHRF